MKPRSSVIAAFWIALVLLPALAGYLLFELRIRSQLWSLYAGNATPMMVINQSLHYWPPVDDFFGRKKTEKSIGDLKVNEKFSVAFLMDGENVFNASADTNNLGFLSEKQYSIKRPVRTREFRIYLAGDSMTGTTTMGSQWVDLLEDLLNSNTELRKAMGGVIFRTYNGGTPGADFKYFWDYFQRAGRLLDPDLIIVNYIESDFPRMGKSGHDAHTDDESLMIQHAAQYTQKFLGQPIPTIFTLMPLYQDMYPAKASYQLSQQLITKLPSMRHYTLRDLMPWDEATQAEVRTWYNLPYDGHMSQNGGKVYAQVMAKLVASLLVGPDKAKDMSFRIPATQVRVVKRQTKWSPNLLADLSSFGIWNGPEPLRINKNSIEVTKGWTAVADGANGGGSLEVFHPMETGMDSQRYLSIRQTSQSTTGMPSLMTEIPGWAQHAGRMASFTANLRVPASLVESEVMIVISATYGSGKDVSPIRMIFNEKITLKSTWIRFNSEFQLPSGASKIWGTTGSEKILIQFLPTEASKSFNVELFTPSFLVDLESGELESRRWVTVGTRKLPASAFHELRQQINEQVMRSRRFSTKMYGLYRLLGKEIPYGYLPAGVSYVSGFVPLTLPNTPSEQVLLNVYCISGQISLDNPDCYHSYQIYAK